MGGGEGSMGGGKGSVGLPWTVQTAVILLSPGLDNSLLHLALFWRNVKCFFARDDCISSALRAEPLKVLQFHLPPPFNCYNSRQPPSQEQVPCWSYLSCCFCPHPVAAALWPLHHFPPLLPNFQFSLLKQKSSSKPNILSVSDMDNPNSFNLLKKVPALMFFVDWKCGAQRLTLFLSVSALLSPISEV